MQQSKLGYPYDYGDELTPEMAQSNRIKMLTILIFIWVLITSLVEAAPLPGTDGFPVRPNQVVQTEIIELFQDQQHQQVVSTIIINRIRIMNRP